MPLQPGLRAGLIPGLKPGLNGNFSAGAPSATQDATSLKYVPTSTAEYAALGIAAPSSIWQCQEASGNLADSVGAVTLTANGTPTYNNAIAGWTRTFLGITEVAAQRFGVAAGTYDPNASSVAWLYYIRIVSSTSVFIVGSQGASGATGLAIGVTGAGLVQTRVNGGNTSSVADHRGQVRPYLLQYNRTAGSVRLITNLETVNGVYSATPADGVKGIGGGAGTPPVMNCGYAAVWTGAAAEGLSAATLTALGW